jgi:sulfate transport system ATP-binding protein
MEIAEQIVVINEGRIEQIGHPRDLYESPTNDFVMGFVGPVTRLDGDLIRPHDIEVLLARDGSGTRATVRRIVHLGFEVRLELMLEGGRELSVQITRARVEELMLAEGQTVYVRPREAAVAA